MLSKSLISIIIPNLNSPIINQVINALLKQNYTNKYEIIIVGQDKYNFLEKFKKDKKIKIITTTKPESPSINRNIGIKKAIGNYLFFIDADCIPCKNWLKFHMNNYQKNNNQVIVGSFLLEKSKNFWQFCDNLSHFHTFSTKRKRGKINVICSSNFSISKKILEKVGIFNEKLRIGEDLELSFRLSQANIPLFFESTAYIIHLPSRNSFFSLLKHSYSWGKYSLNIRMTYSKTAKLPIFMKNRLTLTLMTPIIAFGTTAKIFLQTLPLMKYLYVSPIIVCSKFAWCLGAIFAWRRK